MSTASIHLDEVRSLSNESLAHLETALLLLGDQIHIAAEEGPGCILETELQRLAAILRASRFALKCLTEDAGDALEVAPPAVEKSSKKKVAHV